VGAVRNTISYILLLHSNMFIDAIVPREESLGKERSRLRSMLRLQRETGLKFPNHRDSHLNIFVL
jgi:hypothetical protein